MKYSFLLLLALTGLFITGCGGDDDENMQNSTNLTGTWRLSSLTVNNTNTTTSTDPSFPATEIELDFIGTNLNYTLTFGESDYSTEGSYDTEGTSSINGVVTPLNQSYTNVSGNGTYSLANDIITSNGAFFAFEFNGMPLNQSQEAVMANVESLTDTQLILFQETIEATSTSGISVETDATSRSVWTKQ